MQYENFELFNVAEVEKTKDGFILRRFPVDVIENLTLPLYDKDGNYTEEWIGHRYYAKQLAGAEIRFFSHATEVALKAKAIENGIINVYHGDFLLKSEFVKEGETLDTVFKRNNFVNGIPKKNCNRFNPNVWRICFANGPFEILKVKPNARRRLPKQTELPKKKVLCYGSSITFGGGTPYSYLSYISVMANALGFDVLNKGISGGCQCDKGIKDYLLTEDFDYGYFELCINIAERPLWLIEERMGTLIDEFCTKFPDKKMFFVTPYMYGADISKSADDYSNEFVKPVKVLTEHAKKYPNAIIIDGNKILDKTYYFSADLEHPAEFGHVMQGLNLAKIIKKHIKN